MNQMMTKYLLMPQFVMLLPCPCSEQRADLESMKVLKLCLMGYRFLVCFTVQVSCSKFSYQSANQVHVCPFLHLEPHLTIRSYPSEVLFPFFAVMRKHFAGECQFSKYPVCPKCHKIYESCGSCVETIGTRKSSKYCDHIQFPELYCYNGIKSALQKLLMHPNFKLSAVEVKTCE